MRILQSWLIFWRGAPRAAEAEESLNALLARRQQVRTQHTAPGAEPRPELFRPAQAPTLLLPGEEEPAEQPAQPAPTTPSEPTKPTEEPGPTTPSRLLEAKRRAQKRK
jgi:hypothetical protein